MPGYRKQQSIMLEANMFKAYFVVIWAFACQNRVSRYSSMR